MKILVVIGGIGIAMIVLSVFIWLPFAIMGCSGGIIAMAISAILPICKIGLAITEKAKQKYWEIKNNMKEL